MTVQESESSSPVQLTRELVAAAREVSALASQLKEPTAEVFVTTNAVIIAANLPQGVSLLDLRCATLNQYNCNLLSIALTRARRKSIANGAAALRCAHARTVS